MKNINQQLQYIFHVLLNSKHKILINIFIYLVIISISNIFFNEINIIECMMRSNSFPSIGADEHLVHNDLVYENAQLTEQILSLKQEIELLRDQILTERIENEYTIGTFEENQRYLIGKNRALQAELLEVKETMGQISGDNIELREKLRVQHNYNEILRRNLEISEERNEELSKALLNIAKSKTTEK